jgi:hypothetical protein
MNGRGPLSGPNTDPVDLEPPIDKSSAPILPSGNLITTVPENEQGEEENLEQRQLRTRNRRRNYFDEAEDFFAHRHWNHERPSNVNDAMAAQTKEANPTGEASKGHNMQESPLKGDLEGRVLDGKACPQPDKSGMRDVLESNTGPDPPAPVVSKTEALVSSPESDGSSIPTPILRRLFQTGVFSYQNSFAKDQRETRAPEREEIIPDSHLNGLGNNRGLETNQFLACDTQPSTEEIKHSVEPGYGVPGLHEKLREDNSDTPNYMANHMAGLPGEIRPDSLKQAQFAGMDFHLKVWVTSSENTTLPMHHHMFEADYFPNEIGQRWADQAPPPSKFPLPVSGYPWASKEVHDCERRDIPTLERAILPTAPLAPVAVPVDNYSNQPFVGSPILEEPTASIPSARADPMMDNERLNMQFRGASPDPTGKLMDSSVELGQLENELLPSYGIKHDIIEEHGYRISDYSSSAFLTPGFDPLPRFMDRATSRLSGRKEDLSNRRGTETTEGTIDLDMARFWRPNPFL